MDSPNLVDGFTSLIKPNIIPSTSYPGCAFGKMYFYLPKDEPEPPQYDKSPIYTYAVPCKLPALKILFLFYLQTTYVAGDLSFPPNRSRRLLTV